jgi:response regulator RpfG family c-di-GMP phosphodiesterase
LKESGVLKRIPVFCLNALTSEEKSQILSAGVHDFISYPTDAEELITRLNSALQLSKMHLRNKDSFGSI